MTGTAPIDERDLRIDVFSHAVAGAESHVTVHHMPTGLVGRASNTSQITARREAMQDLEQQLASRTS